MIHLNDHEPAHVHAWRAGAVAKIGIGNEDRAPWVLDPGVMQSSNVRRAVRIVEAHQLAFLNAWEEIHGG